MNKKEIKASVQNLLEKGSKKSAVFAQLSGQGVKDSQLAYFIASYADPKRCFENGRKVKILIWIMFVLALIAFPFGFGIGAQIGPNAKWIFGVFVALIPLLSAWGFYRHKVGAYNVNMLLIIVQFSKSFEGFSANPVATSVGLAVNFALLAYIWYVREKIFPGFAFITPKKFMGVYVFSD